MLRSAEPNVPDAVHESGAHCPNCGHAVAAAFCAACGQETNLRLPTLREFLREAAGRYVALDGRFWRTVVALASRPGWLTREYFAGRRRRYIRPARLYLLSTLLFFAVSRLFVEPVEFVDMHPGAANPDSAKDTVATQARTQKSTEIEGDAVGDDSSSRVGLERDLGLHLPSVLSAAAPSLQKRWDRFNRLPRSEKKAQIAEGMLRYAPYAMFALLPAFALLLKLAYVGWRRRHPRRPRLLGENLVFAAHNHAFLFVALTVMLVVPSRLLRLAIFGWICVYFLKSLRVVYGGSWFGALARGFGLFVTYAMLVALVTLGLLIVAVLLR